MLPARSPMTAYGAWESVFMKPSESVEFPMHNNNCTCFQVERVWIHFKMFIITLQLLSVSYVRLLLPGSYYF
jgi:hypothetical protein